MPIPDLIEIIPLSGPVRAEITVPGSKSITNRALVLASLATGITTLKGALWSEDTQVMVDCLHKLGFEADVQPDPDESCNRTITVRGLGGKIPAAGTAEKPLELFVGNAGTAARFLAAMVCLGDGVYRLSGVPRMHERPQAALFAALRELGYRVDCEKNNDRLPALIHGVRPSATGGRRRCRVSIEQSSQFASALILGAKIGGWQIEIVGENAEESPYVVMTAELGKAFPAKGGSFEIEPDTSSGSYFRGANQILSRRDDLSPEPWRAEVSVAARNWPTSHWQIDTQFPKFLPLPEQVSRARDLGDSIMTAIVLAPFKATPVRFVELGRLRLQECERVAALRTELTKCGVEVLEHSDTLTVAPSAARIHGAEIETYHDHRMAMCFAILGLKVPGIKIINPACVKKTFPNFFQKLATAPPHGLGVEIRDGKTGRKLGLDELFAD